MALRRFTLQAAGGFRGRDAGESFARALIACFGVDTDDPPDGLEFSHAFKVVDYGKRTKRTFAAYWQSRRVAIDVVERDMMLDMAWSDLLRACLQMETEPQYVVLTNQRDVRLYDLARDRSGPRLSIALDELPKYSEAFPFFEPEWVPGTTPKIINVDKVSKEVADLVAKVYRALVAKNPGREEDVIRFTLQCIVAMFSEDIGLLPKEYFTTLLYRAAEAGGSGELLGELFRLMSSEEPNDSGIPFFNGGLFTDPVTCDLKGAPLRALTKAAEANWTFVDPHIFGSVFQGIMDDEERHASGAHYTAREDIMSVVGPTIVDPWRERITAASKLAELKEILADLASYRVLDPACGSGNFLYVAFRELYRLETEVLCRAYEFASVQKGDAVSWASGIRTTNFFGIDTNPFAVELAKTTLNIAKKIAFDERRATVVELFGQGFLEVDPSLPLDNLDENIQCADALFLTWPEVDAIVGNPPFLGGKKVQKELGGAYCRRLRERYSEVHGGADYCAYWFRRAHDSLLATGRAGLIGTSGIRVGNTRAASLDYIVDSGGSIEHAVSEREWPGEAVVHVSMVNWAKKRVGGAKHLVVDGRALVRSEIPSHLQLHADVRQAQELKANARGCSTGVNFGTKAFFISEPVAREVAEDPSSRPFVKASATGSQLLASKAPEFVLDFSSCSSEAEVAKAKSAHTLMRSTVYAEVQGKGAGDASWKRRWWQPRRPYTKFFGPLAKKSRLVACSRHAARPIFFFLSRRYTPTESLQLFGFDDDYSFGILQSGLHWAWTVARGTKLKADTRYTMDVWLAFPWPQEPQLAEAVAVAEAGRKLRATRDRLMVANDWSLRELHQSAEVSGPHPLKDAQAELDAAVEVVYGKPEDQEATEFLLELNLALAEDEADGHKIEGPGLPEALAPEDSRWISSDCMEPPPLAAEHNHG